MFRIIVPLDDEYSFDYNLGNESKTDTVAGTNGTEVGTKGTEVGTNGTKVGTNQDEDIILEIIRADGSVTQRKIEQETNISLRSIKRIMAKLQTEGRIVRIGSHRGSVRL